MSEAGNPDSRRHDLPLGPLELLARTNLHLAQVADDPEEAAYRTAIHARMIECGLIVPDTCLVPDTSGGDADREAETK